MGAPAPSTTSLRVTFLGDGSGVVGELGLGNLHTEPSGARNRFKDPKNGVTRMSRVRRPVQAGSRFVCHAGWGG